MTVRLRAEQHDDYHLDRCADRDAIDRIDLRHVYACDRNLFILARPCIAGAFGGLFWHDPGGDDARKKLDAACLT